MNKEKITLAKLKQENIELYSKEENPSQRVVQWYSISKDKFKELKSYYTSNSKQSKKAQKIEQIDISEFGAVRIKYSDEEDSIDMELEDEPGKSGYLRIKDYPGFGYIYTLAADAFEEHHVMLKLEDGFPEQKNCTYDIHHINNNGYQNTPNNLIRLKRCEHAQIHTYMKNFPESCYGCKYCPINKDDK